jgi:hypothetical protein
VCAAVVAGVDAPPVLQLAEHVLDLVALSVEQPVMRYLDFPVGFRWDTGFDLPVCKGVAQPVRIVTLVGQQNSGSGHGSHQGGGTCVITDLACREKQGPGPPLAIANCMQFRV